MRSITVVQLLVSLNMIVPIFAVPLADTLPIPGVPLTAGFIGPSAIPSPPQPGAAGVGAADHRGPHLPVPIRRFSAELERRVVREADFGASPDATAQPDTAMPAPTPAPQIGTDPKKAASIVERRVVREADFGASPNSTSPGTAAPPPAAALRKRSTEANDKRKSKGHKADEDDSVVPSMPSMPDTSAPSLSGSSVTGAAGGATKQVGSLHHSLPNPLASPLPADPSSATGAAPVSASAVPHTRRNYFKETWQGMTYTIGDIPKLHKRHSAVIDTDPILPQDETRPGSPAGANSKNIGILNLDSNEQPKPVKSKVASSTRAASTETSAAATATPSG